MKAGKVSGSGITYPNHVLLKANRFRSETVQRLALGSDIFIFWKPGSTISRLLALKNHLTFLSLSFDVKMGKTVPSTSRDSVRKKMIYINGSPVSLGWHSAQKMVAFVAFIIPS